MMLSRFTFLLALICFSPSAFADRIDDAASAFHTQHMQFGFAPMAILTRQMQQSVFASYVLGHNSENPLSPLSLADCAAVANRMNARFSDGLAIPPITAADYAANQAAIAQGRIESRAKTLVARFQTQLREVEIPNVEIRFGPESSRRRIRLNQRLGDVSNVGRVLDILETTPLGRVLGRDLRRMMREGRLQFRPLSEIPEAAAFQVRPEYGAALDIPDDLSGPMTIYLDPMRGLGVLAEQLAHEGYHATDTFMMNRLRERLALIRRIQELPESEYVLEAGESQRSPRSRERERLMSQLRELEDRNNFVSERDAHDAQYRWRLEFLARFPETRPFFRMAVQSHALSFLPRPDEQIAFLYGHHFLISRPLPIRRGLFHRRFPARTRSGPIDCKDLFTDRLFGSPAATE